MSLIPVKWSRCDISIEIPHLVSENRSNFSQLAFNSITTDPHFFIFSIFPRKCGEAMEKMNKAFEKVKIMVGMDAEDEEQQAAALNNSNSFAFMDDFNRNCTLSTTQVFYFAPFLFLLMKSTCYSFRFLRKWNAKFE